MHHRGAARSVLLPAVRLPRRLTVRRPPTGNRPNMQIMVDSIRQYFVGEKLYRYKEERSTKTDDQQPKVLQRTEQNEGRGTF